MNEQYTSSQSSSILRPIHMLRNDERDAALHAPVTGQDTPPPEVGVIPPRLTLKSRPQASTSELALAIRNSAAMQTVTPQKARTEDKADIYNTTLRQEDFSLYHTLILPALTRQKPTQTTQVSNTITTATLENPLIYLSTGEARRLEKRRRIEEKKLSWRDLRRFRQFVTPFKWQIGLAFLLSIAVGLTTLPIPFIVHTMIDLVFPGHDTTLFTWLLLLLFGVFLLKEGLRFLNRSVSSALSRSANLNIIYRFYRHMLSLPLSFCQEITSTGQILSRLNEVTSVQQTVLQTTIDIAVNVILTLIYIVMLLLTDWRLSLVVLVVSPLYLGSCVYFNRRVRHLSRKAQDINAVMKGSMYEGLAGLKTIKALAAEHRFARCIKKLIIQTNQLLFRYTILQAEASYVVGIVQAGCIIAILSFGGSLTLSGTITAGQFAAFILLLRELSFPATALNGINQQLQAAAVALDHLFEILNHPEEKVAEKGIVLTPIRGEIIFERVHFSYIHGQEVLHDITFHVRAGSTVALVGRSGVGKTTIANLLLRFYLPTHGRITIDGYDLRDLQIENLRSQYGVILQDDALFSGTIEDNLTFGLLRKCSFEELREAARNANILDFIEAQPHGFKTLLKERGQLLSHGQRQRLSIARMFLRQPRILIMDEPSSALDNESEALIQQALKHLMRGRTTFIIAHRFSTIRDADCVIVIDDGCIAEQGTHEALLQHQGIYRHLYQSHGRV